ncbi:MAG: membrane protein insertase YidC [Gammaproteobacteria bacterium]|nr:membrane protein insertase YidC [Rhodocyclaceae bacterium]MBU3907736.1 membrane protein insertase YidC [Gammaproteobacteria bacterium]MBU3989832.1 membrane protein insertase YidC [Gammaproteobacteria bacterium]MBU4004382.1 membrane protein insertase YidC [Gammaproteobacteria bacterium]MBU4019791.1 membrane protein insertase YidC [Gammaproteobacteria bacterium]
MNNQRLILLLVFFFSIMMLWDAWLRQGQPAQPAKTAQQESAQTQGTGASSAAVPSAPTFAAAPGAVPVPGSAGVNPAVTGAAVMKVKTDLVVADISAQGGDLVRLELLHHHATENRKENFILLDAAHHYAAQSGLIGVGLPNHKSVWRLPAEALTLKDGENELRVALEAAVDGGGKVVKTYVFKRGSYLVDVEHALVGAAAPAGASAYFQLTRDDKSPEGANAMMMTFTGAAIYTDQEKFRKVEFKDFGGKNKHLIQADNGWVAMVQHYFFSAWLPAGGSEREYFTRQLGGDLFAAGVVVPFAGDKLSVPFYSGPQEQDKLDKIAPGLSLVVDYGWLTMIAAPLFWVLEWLHKFVGNWGWAIILLTMLIKGVFFPLSAASYKSMAKMRVLTPKLTKLKEAYGDDKARMNQEMMELYKREKVNPLGGCLPILVQIPVFIALYWVLLGTVEMRGAPWLGWITDLTAKDPFFILPVIMGVTMFVQTKLNPTPPDPIQAKIMLWMPIVFTGMFLFFPSGLVLYWTVNNALSIAQQWQINRMIEGAAKQKTG